MAWDCLEDEINAEFSAFIDDGQMEDELFRRHCVRSARSRAAPDRPSVGVVDRKCEGCGESLQARSRGPLEQTCSDRCRQRVSRKRRRAAVTGLTPSGHEANLICPRHAQPPNRDAGYRNLPT